MASPPRVRGWTTWLVVTIYAGCLTAFIADLASANTLAFGVFYSPLIVTAVFYRDKRAVWVLTTVACAMVVVGSFFPTLAIDVRELIENRALSIMALIATAAFIWHARTAQEQLSEQTRRAEAAERIKTEVLTNLSQEIRGPLYSIIGVLELVAANSRPDQKAALAMVRGAGRRLASTIDNLVDLTQFADQPMPAEPIDLGQLLRQTAEAHRADAQARQIGLAIDIPSDQRRPGGGEPMGVAPDPGEQDRRRDHLHAAGRAYRGRHRDLGGDPHGGDRRDRVMAAGGVPIGQRPQPRAVDALHHGTGAQPAAGTGHGHAAGVQQRARRGNHVRLPLRAATRPETKDA